MKNIILKIVNDEIEGIGLDDKIMDYTDSLGAFELMSILSNETDINFIDMELNKDTTVRDIFDRVEVEDD